MTPTAGGPNPAASRLALTPRSQSLARFDGAWWPRTRNLAVEVSALAAALTPHAFHLSRVAYGKDGWAAAGRKAASAGRTIRLGWFASQDPAVVILGDGHGGRLDLLVVPPDSTSAKAQTAMAEASRTGNTRAASDILGRDQAPEAHRPPH